MKNIKSAVFSDRMTLVGLALIVVSFFTFVVGGMVQTRSIEGAFLINYGFSAGYLFYILIQIIRYRKGVSPVNIRHTTILLILWFISAFALNRECNVFDTSVPWLCVYLILAVSTLLLALLMEHFSGTAKRALSFLMGAAVLLFGYYAIYLLPLYAISIIGVIAIGLSLHTYAPLCLAIISLVIIRRTASQHSGIWPWFSAGIGLPLLFAAAFLTQWGSLNNKINLILNHHTLSQNKLPAWVQVSQQIPHSAIAEKLLKAGLVYDSFDRSGSWLWEGMPSHAFGEPKQHDPLVMMATLVFRQPNLDQAGRIKILESMYDSRYQAVERLWDGDQLETASVTSNVKLFPEYRLAYTEKILTVRNNDQHSWAQSGEAIYTFHLPEGSVVTSLSLWIDGKEAKGRLTTKAKADSAYRQVVGVEQHDPSIVQWQEGNRVMVRVFPCNTTENRKVKIGFTSPLRLDVNRLIYENIYFDGPTGKHATESVQLSFSEKPDELHLPDFISESDATGDVYRVDRTYGPYWEISCRAPELSKAVFNFGGADYRVKNYQPTEGQFEAKTIFLDLNSAWEKQEFAELWNKIKTKPVFVYQEKLTALTDKNKDQIFEEMTKLNFSVFPVYKITDPDSSLLISKSGPLSPNLSDLEDSEFTDRLTQYLAQPKKINLFNIGDQLSPYLKSLKELRLFNYEHGDVVALSTLMGNKQFAQTTESDSIAVIDQAQLMLQKLPGSGMGTAPDHLMRLFSYNDLMRKAGPGYFNKTYLRPDLITEAQQAYVVSPLSSLIVLETQEDYKRFGIDDGNASLQNASMKSAGSVPEPKDWMLIALVAAVILVMMFKRRPADLNY